MLAPASILRLSGRAEVLRSLVKEGQRVDLRKKQRNVIRVAPQSVSVIKESHAFSHKETVIIKCSQTERSEFAVYNLADFIYLVQYVNQLPCLLRLPRV